MLQNQEMYDVVPLVCQASTSKSTPARHQNAIFIAIQCKNCNNHNRMVCLSLPSNHINRWVGPQYWFDYAEICFACMKYDVYDIELYSQSKIATVSIGGVSHSIGCPCCTNTCFVIPRNIICMILRNTRNCINRRAEPWIM